jgi:hypothetical protein
MLNRFMACNSEIAKCNQNFMIIRLEMQGFLWDIFSDFSELRYGFLEIFRELASVFGHYFVLVAGEMQAAREYAGNQNTAGEDVLWWIVRKKLY